MSLKPVLATIIALTFSSSIALASRELACKGNLLVYENANYHYQSQSYTGSKIRIDESVPSIQLAFDKGLDLATVQPWQGLTWAKLPFAYNSELSLTFDGDSFNGFRVDASYKGKKKTIACKYEGIYY